MTDYYTDADLIRDALSKHGPLSRSDLVEKTNLERAVIAKSLYSLKKQGHVIEEGDRLMLTKAAEMAQDAPEETEKGIGSTPAVESGTGLLQAEPVTDYPDTIQIVEDVAHLACAYRAAQGELHRMKTEYASLIADRKAYHALKTKLRGMLDD